MSLPLPFHEVRYEDMQRALARPRGSCSTSAGSRVTTSCSSRSWSDHFSKLPRTGPAVSSCGRVGDWHRDWSRTQLLLFTAAAGEALELTGYAGPMPKRAQQVRDLLLRYERLKHWM